MNQSTLEQKCQNIRLVVTDVDGVLTDGGMYYAEAGDELKKFNVRDGAGLALLRHAGLRVGCMTGENTKLVRRRLEKLAADFICVGVRDKRRALDELLPQFDCNPDQVAYVGDEINDTLLLGHVALFLAPADAARPIRQAADLVLTTRGGDGVFNEVADLLLTATNQYHQALAAYQQHLVNIAKSTRGNGDFIPLQKPR